MFLRRAGDPCKDLTRSKTLIGAGTPIGAGMLRGAGAWSPDSSVRVSVIEDDLSDPATGVSARVLEASDAPTTTAISAAEESESIIR